MRKFLVILSPRSSYDIELDVECLDPNDMESKKMISGIYLGDIVRGVNLRMSQESDILGPVSSWLSNALYFEAAELFILSDDKRVCNSAGKSPSTSMTDDFKKYKIL